MIRVFLLIKLAVFLDDKSIPLIKRAVFLDDKSISAY
jgi:hypothetical protein